MSLGGWSLPRLSASGGQFVPRVGREPTCRAEGCGQSAPERCAVAQFSALR